MSRDGFEGTRGAGEGVEMRARARRRKGRAWEV